MKDWNTFAKIHQEHVSTTGEKPKVLNYILLKTTDNMLVIAVFFLTLIFAYAGLYSMSMDADAEKINWSLHAAELCLGVFLGLLKGAKKN